MKTHYLSMLAATALCMSQMAVADNALVVHRTDGQATYPLQSVERITFGDDAFVLHVPGLQAYYYQDVTRLDFGTWVSGDVTGDGIVDVADVNAVINAILTKATSNESQAICDVTGDGTVDVADVNAVINKILNRDSQTTDAGSYRMVASGADFADVYVVDSVTSITFVEIPQATTTITLMDADDSSVRARVTKTEGTARYEVACYRADEVPADVEAYIRANKKFNRKANGAVEFVDLTPSTQYVLAALAYDRYDLPCEVSTLEFATSERIITEPAQVGGYLFSDGSWSSELKSNKTPVGIIFSTETTQADQALGYTHGYALALKDAGTAAWTTEGDENESGSSLTDGQDITDREGLTKSRILLEKPDKHPAAKAANDYAAVPYGTSGWFLPATGQWVEVMSALGGLDTASMTRTDAGIASWSKEAATAALTALDARMAAVGQGKYSPLNKTYYWSASERSVASAYYLYIHTNYGMMLQTYYKDSAFTVRPIIAF